jgi:hypothetical protein
MVKEVIKSFEMLTKCNRNEIYEGLSKYGFVGDSKIIGLFKYIIGLVDELREIDKNKDMELGIKNRCRKIYRKI